MRAHSVNRLQVLGMHQQSGKFIAVQLQPEEDPASHIVDAALHGPVHSLGVVVVIVLGACGMELQIALLVIGLLKQNIGPDSRLF